MAKLGDQASYQNYLNILVNRPSVVDIGRGPWDVVESVVKEPIQVEGAFDVVDGADASKSGPFNKDDQALVDLAKEGKKKGGLDRDEAVTLVELGKESKDPRINGDKSRGPEVHKDRKFKDEHIHIGPVDHIPVKN